MPVKHGRTTAKSNSARPSPDVQRQQGGLESQREQTEPESQQTQLGLGLILSGQAEGRPLAPFNADTVLKLQRMYGNQAVQRMLDQRAVAPEAQRRAGSTPAVGARTPHQLHHPERRNHPPSDRSTEGDEAVDTLSTDASRPIGTETAPAFVPGAPHEHLQRASIQRNGGFAKTMVKGQALGLLKTTLPVFGWKGYYKSLDDIWVADNKDSQAKYGNTFWKIMNSLVETSDRVASYFTAATMLLTIIGTILTAAQGAGAPLLAAATICGIVATIAHAVTFLLRGIVTIYDIVRLKNMEKGSRERALLKGKIWTDVAGLISNGIGVLMGGLGGGFIGGTNVIGGALSSKFGDVAGAMIGADIGEGANRVADAAALTGKHKAATLDSKNPKTPSTPRTAPLDSGQDDGGALMELATIARDIEKSSSDEQPRLIDSQTKRTDAVQGMKDAGEKLGDVTGKTVKISDEGGKASDQVGTATEDAAKQIAASKLDKEKVLDLEEKVDNAEQAAKPFGIESDEEKTPSDEKDDQQSDLEKEWNESAISLKRDANGQSRSKADSTGGRPRVQRGFGSMIKGIPGRLWARVVNVGKRVKKLGAKIKLKMMQFVAKAMGITKPAQEAIGETQEAQTILPEAIKADQATLATTAVVAEQAGKLKSLTDQAQKDT
jgi:hypothetical protein